MIHKILNPIPLPDDVPFIHAKNLTVNISVEDCGKNDFSVEDFSYIGPDIDDTIERVTQPQFTLTHAIIHNSISLNLIPRDE